MRSGRARSLLTLLLAFALFVPTFWVIDAMQGEAASPDASAGEVTLRFDESRTQQEIVFDEGAEDVSISAPPGHAEDSGSRSHGSQVITHVPSVAASAVLWPMTEFRLPPLLTVERLRLSRLLLPEQPSLRVATPPPLLLA